MKKKTTTTTAKPKAKTKPKKAAPSKCPSMSEDDLRAFVLGYCDGHIFTSEDVPKEQLQFIFMPLLLAPNDTFTKMKDIAVVWESTKNGSTIRNMGINGFPIFTSCRVMNRADWSRAVDAIKAETQRRKEIHV